ncbi:putative membrane protein YccC [Actinoallomurus bryophytorum]|uniref:Putative membrane protein YccC n=1 Tax=Actinoallomurus bryophytorum TaxID=1490222 RepID=A0A543CJS3_9ACTN|nr:FUSC family protein [Actinoallomurus bryophytorum]TQL97362.1 putative membrane protein YccC [Actinoallomurus bryophytorum]
MGASFASLRATYAESEGQAAPVYGTVTAVGVATPLLVGLLTGHAAESVLVALGAFYVALAAPGGPYGARARALLIAVAVVTVFTWLGGSLSGHPWLAVAAVPVVATLASMLPWMGATATLCTVLAAIRPTTSPVIFDGFLEMSGGLFVSALLVAPWITHRLRPLRMSLAEVAGSVAAALDVLATPGPDEEEWTDRRRRAYEAIRQARVTYGLYRAGGRDDQERPRQLIEAFRRTMDEAVALRAMLTAVRADSPPEHWERECRVAVSSLAARLRLLAGGIEARGGRPLGGDGAVALDRFARVTEEVRQEWLAGQPDLVATALLLRVRQAVERMAASVGRARQILDHGLTLGIDVPHLPERPVGGWSRFKEAVRTRSPGFRHAVRVGVAVAAAMALATGLKLPHGHWLTITVLLSLRDSYGDTVKRVIKRVGGTAIGAIVAALALAIAPGEATLVVLIFVGAILGFTFRSANYAYWMMFSTPMVMLLVDFSDALSWSAAAWRIGLTLAGGLLALAAARGLWSSGTPRRVPGQVSELMRSHARLVRAVAARFDGDDEAPVRRRTEDAVAAENDLEESAKRLGREPSPPIGLITGIRAAGTAARSVRDDLKTLVTLQEEDLDAGPVCVILDRIADHLDARADAPEAENGALDLGDLLEEFDDHLSGLDRRRRDELADGVGTDAVTTLRRLLIQAASARHAVRSLVADTESLTATGPAEEQAEGPARDGARPGG